MGRREFYAIVDETYRKVEAQNQSSTGTWEGYGDNQWYRKAREMTGRKPV